MLRPSTVCAGTLSLSARRRSRAAPVVVGRRCSRWFGGAWCLPLATPGGEAGSRADLLPVPGALQQPINDCSPIRPISRRRGCRGCRAMAFGLFTVAAVLLRRDWNERASDCVPPKGSPSLCPGPLCWWERPRSWQPFGSGTWATAAGSQEAVIATHPPAERSEEESEAAVRAPRSNDTWARTCRPPNVGWDLR
jgi:hypothetical protein